MRCHRLLLQLVLLLAPATAILCQDYSTSAAGAAVSEPAAPGAASALPEARSTARRKLPFLANAQQGGAGGKAAQHRAPDHSSGALETLIRGYVVCGSGAAYTAPAMKPTAMCGVGFGMIPFVTGEFGVMGPAYNHSGFTAYFSEDADFPLPMPFHWVLKAQGHPTAAVGYTRMFETGRNALNYGVGFEHHRGLGDSVIVEARDYWTFATPEPNQHNVVLRVALMVGGSD